MSVQIRGDDASRHIPETSAKKKTGQRDGNSPEATRPAGKKTSAGAKREDGALPVEKLDASNDE
jgi:hypothetical protein